LKNTINDIVTVSDASVTIKGFVKSVLDVIGVAESTFYLALKTITKTVTDVVSLTENYKQGKTIENNCQ